MGGGYGVAAEIGHIPMVPYGRRCGCGLQGCWEQYGSGRALVTEAREIARHSPAFAAGLLEVAGGDPEAIVGEMVTTAAQSGDVAGPCTASTRSAAGSDWAAPSSPRCSTRRCSSSVAACPRRGRCCAARVETIFRGNLTGRGHRPVAEVRLAELGWEAGMVGAADLARTPSRHRRGGGHRVTSMITGRNRAARRRPRPGPRGPHRRPPPKAILVSIVAALGGFLFGFDTAVINGAVDAIRDDFGLERRRSPASPSSCALLGSAVGAWFAGPRSPTASAASASC